MEQDTSNMGFGLLIAFIYMIFRTINELTTPGDDSDEN